MAFGSMDTFGGGPTGGSMSGAAPAMKQPNGMVPFGKGGPKKTGGGRRSPKMSMNPNAMAGAMRMLAARRAMHAQPQMRPGASMMPKLGI